MRCTGCSSPQQGLGSRGVVGIETRGPEEYCTCATLWQRGAHRGSHPAVGALAVAGREEVAAHLLAPAQPFARARFCGRRLAQPFARARFCGRRLPPCPATERRQKIHILNARTRAGVRFRGTPSPLSLFRWHRPCLWIAPDGLCTQQRLNPPSPLMLRSSLVLVAGTAVPRFPPPDSDQPGPAALPARRPTAPARKWCESLPVCEDRQLATSE